MLIGINLLPESSSTKLDAPWSTTDVLFETKIVPDNDSEVSQISAQGGPSRLEHIAVVQRAQGSHSKFMQQSVRPDVYYVASVTNFGARHPSFLKQT